MVTLAKLNPHNYETNSEQASNLSILCDRLNQLSSACGMEFQINSGLRSEADQARINPSAPRSKHLLGAAADVGDIDGKLWQWVLDNLDTVAAVGLWMEDKHYTPTWVHFQSQPCKSGKRIFIP